MKKAGAEEKTAVEESRRNHSIQLLRVVACLLVFMVHFGQRMELDGMARRITDFGSRGVQLFFLISGYLAASTFVGKQNVDVRKYYTKRAIAVLPLYYLAISYYFITENFLNQFYDVIPTDELGMGWLRYLFLLNGFLNSETYFWSNLGITWTIPIFVFFYLTAPWILRRVKDVRSGLLVWGSVLLACKGIQWIYPCTIANHLPYLFWGVVLYCCASEGVSAQAIAWFAAAALGFLTIKNSMAAYICLFSCILLAMLEIPNFALPGRIQRVVDTLDRYSYTLYLMHGVVFCSLIDRLVYRDVPKIFIVVLAVMGTSAATWIVGKYMEKPIQSALRKRFLH